MTPIYILVGCVFILAALEQLQYKAQPIRFKYRIKPYKYKVNKQWELVEKEAKTRLKASKRYVSIGFKSQLRCEEFKRLYPHLVQLKPKKKQQESSESDED